MVVAEAQRRQLIPPRLPCPPITGRPSDLLENTLKSISKRSLWRPPCSKMEDLLQRGVRPLTTTAWLLFWRSFAPRPRTLSPLDWKKSAHFTNRPEPYFLNCQRAVLDFNLQTVEVGGQGTHYTPRGIRVEITKTALAPHLYTRRSPGHGVPHPFRICDPAMGTGNFLLEALDQLDATSALERHHPLARATARQEIVSRQLWGADRDPDGCRSCPSPLVARGRSPRTQTPDFSPNLYVGDSLLGIDLEQLRHFHWAPTRAPLVGAIDQRIKSSHRDSKTARRIASRLLVSVHRERTQRRTLSFATQRAGPLLAGRTAKLPRWQPRQDHGQGDHLSFTGLYSALARALQPQTSTCAPEIHPLPVKMPSHKVEFPLSGVVEDDPPGTHGNADLSAHFLRRADSLLAQRGSIGLVATNTIAQETVEEQASSPCSKATLFERRHETSPGPTPQHWSSSARSIYLGMPDGSALRASLALVGPPWHRGSDQVEAIGSRLNGRTSRPRPIPENTNLAFQGSIAPARGHPQPGGTRRASGERRTQRNTYSPLHRCG